MPVEFTWAMFSGITLKAWRYSCKIPERLTSAYGYPRGHRLYVKCTQHRQVRDVPKGWIFL